MKTLKKTGRSVDFLIQEIKNEYQITDDQFTYDIIQHQSKAFLGLFGGKPAIVNFFIDELEDKMRSFLEGLLSRMSIEFDSIEIIKEDANFNMSISNPSDPGFVIGKDGKFLDNLQYIVNRAIFKNEADKNIIRIDVDGYRQRRNENLLKRIQMITEKVIKTKKSYVLEPMHSGDRRLVHQVVLEDERLKTTTIGEGNSRRIVISLAKAQAPKNQTTKSFKSVKTIRKDKNHETHSEE